MSERIRDDEYGNYYYDNIRLRHNYCGRCPDIGRCALINDNIVDAAKRLLGEKYQEGRVSEVKQLNNEAIDKCVAEKIGDRTGN